MGSSDASWYGSDQERARRLARASDVPKALERAVAAAMGVNKERVSWLKETLGTKDEKQARILAKPVMMKFDRLLAQG